MRSAGRVLMWAENSTMKTDLVLDHQSGERLYGWKVYHLGFQHYRCPA
jgi:hypothetical protein